MRKHSVNNSPNPEKTVGFQQVAGKSFGNYRDMKLLVFGGQQQQQPVHGMNAVGVASYCGPIDVPDKCSRDCFYEKLDKLHESSGLTFIFNLREAKLDLYLLYEAVTERDGFQEVSKHGKWKEVASLFNLKNQHSMLPCQFQKVYENLLYRYEQTYFYRMPVKASTKEGYSQEDGQSLDCLSLKRKYFENRSKDCAEKVQSTSVSYRESTTVQYVAPQEFGSEPLSGFVSPVQKADIQTTWDDKKSIDNIGFSTKVRTGYQLFLRDECDRLKKIHGESPTGALNFRDRASEKWKNMSDLDRQPYREASQKERDIYNREVPTDDQPKLYKRRRYQKRQNQQSVSAPNDDKPALVTMEADIGNPSTLLVEMENRESNVSNDQQTKQYMNTNTEADIGNPSTLLVEMESRESNVANDQQTKQYKNTNTNTEADIGNPSTLVEMESRECYVTNDQQTKQYKNTNTEADIGNSSTILVEMENRESNVTNDQQTKEYKNTNTEADISNPSTLVEMENLESNITNDQQTEQFKDTNTEADIGNPSTLAEMENRESNVANDQQTMRFKSTNAEADISNPSTLVEMENRESNITNDQQTEQYKNTNTEADISNPSTLVLEMENSESNVTNDQQTEQNKNTNTEHDKKPTEEIIYFAEDDVYHVKLEPDVGSTAVVPDESLVEITIQALKNARPTDPIFQTNWADLSDCSG